MASKVMVSERRSFAGEQFYDVDFSNRDLVHADFHGCKLIGCNFDSADLSYANLEGTNCYRASFRNARLHSTNFKDANLSESIFHPRDAFGVTLSMSCGSFYNTDVSALHVSEWVHLLSTLKLPKEIKDDLRAIGGKLVGTEQFAKLVQLIERRSL